jgi:hypothetical protein
MASKVRQHAIDRGCSKDTFANMQVGSVTVGSKKKKKTASTDAREINFIYSWLPPQSAVLLASTWVSPTLFERGGTNRGMATEALSSIGPG